MLVSLYRFKNKFTRKLIYRYLVKYDGGEMWSKKLRQIYKKYYNIEIGIGTYGYNFGGFPAGTQIGKYCSLASYITVINVNHTMTTITTHPYLFNPVVGFIKSDFRTKTKLSIGNDVWIGQNTIILPKVSKIGNGAIIGAGSVVTKNVEPYSIVAGNPANLIGYRFDRETIMKLEEIKWWDFELDYIKNNLNKFYDVSTFIAEIKNE
ncbi:MAG: transferase hexapeptide repeat containing protein [Clostridiales bacterium]|jgi:acetyltransferase-like isoleucine patch superfamily enzyme|nr:transferase hexapeptide repeat containing protein [Clostridiales bacterium]